MVIDGKQIAMQGVLPRMARLSAEYYEYIDEADDFVAKLRRARSPAHIFTFLQRTAGGSSRLPFHAQNEQISVLNISSYDHWFKKQVNDKTRNMVRRATKKGVEIRVVDFSDDLIVGIKGIYDESRLRQGKPFAHYGKDLETLKLDHASYLDRSDFIGAYLGDELIGFIKLVHGSGVSNVMQIVSMVAHRDKAPTNALLAKAIEICAQKGVPRLHYGLWSRGGLGEFKQHHGFEPFDVHRYFVPLGLIGSVALKLGLHRKLSERLPRSWLDYLVSLRARWNTFKYSARARAC
jgi:hypothetical protein